MKIGAREKRKKIKKIEISRVKDKGKKKIAVSSCRA